MNLVLSMEISKMGYSYLTVQTEAEIMKMRLTSIWRKDLQTHTDLVMPKLTNFVWCCEKSSIHMSELWGDGNSIKHHHCQKRKNSTVTWQNQDITDVDYELTKIVSKHFQTKKSKQMFRSICAKQYFTTGSCICKLLPQVFCGIWTWPNSISFSIRIKVMSIIEANKSFIRIFCKLWCTTDDRKYLRGRTFHTIHRYAKANNK